MRWTYSVSVRSVATSSVRLPGTWHVAVSEWHDETRSTRAVRKTPATDASVLHMTWLSTRPWCKVTAQDVPSDELGGQAAEAGVSASENVPHSATQQGSACGAPCDAPQAPTPHSQVGWLPLCSPSTVLSARSSGEGKGDKHSQT